MGIRHQGLLWHIIFNEGRKDYRISICGYHVLRLCGNKSCEVRMATFNLVDDSAAPTIQSHPG